MSGYCSVSKSLRIPAGEARPHALVHGMVTEFLDANADVFEQNGLFTITYTPAVYRRAGKKMLKDTLDKFLTLPDAKPVYKAEGIHFDFARREYRYNDAPLFLTAGEQLALYMLTTNRATTPARVMVSKLQKRVGTKFLKGLLGGGRNI